jgi:hypothetical protein
MSDPYTNWLDLTVAESMGITPEVVDDLLTNFPENKKEEFHINDIRGSVGFRPDFYTSEFSPIIHTNDDLYTTLKAITVNTDDLLFNKIISKENAIWVKPGLTYNCEKCLSSCKVILTEKGMSLLNHDPQDENISTVFLKDQHRIIPIEVVAVVKSLPYFYEVACSPEFADINGFDRTEKYVIQFEEGDNSCMFLADEKNREEEIDSLAQAFFKRKPDSEFDREIKSGNKVFRKINMYFSAAHPPSAAEIDSFIVSARKNGLPLGLLSEYNCSAPQLSGPPRIGRIAFNFKDLNEIPRFEEYMLARDIEIDKGQIEEKENFALVSSLTWTISIILLAFGVLSIILFVNNLLRTHLFKVRTNLGTFKAFGLSNSFLNTIYLKIISVFLLIAIIIAFLLTALVDLVESLISTESKFNIFSPWVLVAIILLVIVSLFISFKTSKKILGDTPGNLIYNR